MKQYGGFTVNDKRHNHRLFRALLVGLILLLVSVTVALAASNIDPTHKWAWGTNVGWINLNPDNGGVTVYSDHLEGYAWGENISWIRLGTYEGGDTHTYANDAADTYGVNNDGVGNLSGYAWGKDVGWINFAPTNGGVTIDPVTGAFDGYAWGENIGWIHFRTVQIPVTVPPTHALLDGPLLGVIDSAHTFTATLLPLTTTLPITYTWQTAGAPLLIHPARQSLTDTASLTWTTTGSKNVIVTATNGAGVVTATTIVTITDVPITGLFAINDSPTPLDQITTLTATVVAGSDITYTWNFGDNTTGNGDVVTHTYSNVGVYTAVVTASNIVNVVTATTTVDISAVVYLPMVAKRWPPLPDTPVLNAISNPGGVRNYAVTWNTAYLAETYTLQEATDAAFSSATTRYTGSGTSWNASNKSAGTYYYRVKATNSYGDSGWSNVQSVQVLPPLPTTFYATGDTDILQGYANTNSGTLAYMWVGYDDYLNPDGKIARSLIAFNTSAIPSNVAIDQALLRVYLVDSWDYPGESRTVTTYRISSPWSESNVTWNSQPSFAQAYGSASVSHDVKRWYSFDVTNLVRGWINGTLPNYGIMLRGPEYSGSDSSWKSFSTREGEYTPQLIITYSGQTTQGIGANETTFPTGHFTETIILTLTGNRPNSHAALCSFQLAGEKCLTYTPYLR